MLKNFFVFSVGLIGLSLLLIVGAYFGLVVFPSGSGMDRETIKTILARQSPVYYSDGETVMGYFFRNSHRLYVPYQKIPDDFINGIIAAEDQEFFSHPGVDLTGIFRAFIANVKAGRVVQGGSTITQQTAKNLFKRQERSLKAKLKELLYALRLEHHYSKEEILTFYANQFYVSGNGRGLGVAARYYFDKEVDDLTLVECAFIAGSVKGPNYYNPFTKSDPEDKGTARERAKERTAYVLKKMHSLGMITSLEYHRALGEEIPFNKGRMRYPLNTVMDMVEEGLNAIHIREALADHGIDNVATSGIKVVTTIDRNIQESAVYSMRKTLSRLDIRLSGYERDKVQRRYGELNLKRTSSPADGDFLPGRVVSVDREGPPAVEVKLGDADHLTGIIDRRGLLPALTALVKYERQRWSEPEDGDWPLLLDQINEGDLIYVSVQGHNKKTGSYELVLEKYPTLQGGALVIRDSLIRALVGGYSNFYFNRAVQAKRPMGSTFKAPLYAAAIQLGWNNLDLLDNRRRNFVYQNKPYYPKPDHYSPHGKVTMAWAGVNSENVASVWLLYNLCNHLTPAQFKDLLEHLGMARKGDESYGQYRRRVRDEMGIVVNNKTLEQTAFAAALSICRADLAFAGREDEMNVLERFFYSDEFVDRSEDEAEGEEAEIRKELSSYSFQRMRLMADELKSAVAQLNSAAVNRGAGDSEETGDLPVPNLYIHYPSNRSPLFSGRGYTAALAEGEYIFTHEEEPGEYWVPVYRHELLKVLDALSEGERITFWNSVRLDNLLSLEAVKIVENCLQGELKRLKRHRRYSPEVLRAVPDFRILAGLKYLIGLCRTAGVESDLKPVLSFPLGSNVVSLHELCRVYEGIMTGKVRESEMGVDAGVHLISRIMAPSGEVIYSLNSTIRRVSDFRTAIEVSDILRNVVSHGTGRYANRVVRIRKSSSSQAAELLTGDLQLPLFGKTGTADNYINSTFVGAVPGLADSGNGVNLENPDIIGAYLGYDNNRPMARTSTHITGASGALRVWTGIARDIVQKGNYADSLDFVDLAFTGAEEVPLSYLDLGQIRVPVNGKNGRPKTNEFSAEELDPAQAFVTTFAEIGDNGELLLERHYRPYWEQTAD